MKRRLSRKSAHQVYRTKDGKVVPGASTISKIGEDQSFLIAWAHKQGTEGLDYRKTTDEAAGIGSVAHFLITCHFKGDEADLDEFTPVEVEKGTQVFQKFLETWAEMELSFVANELELVSELGYGGTIDIIARDKSGKLVLCDEKSSPRIYGHFYRQVAGYENLWNENNSEKIARRVIFRHGKKDPNDTEVRWIGSTEKHFDVFKCQLALYQAQKKL